VIASTFAEGVASIALPCSWILLLPAGFAVIGARGRRSVVAGVCGGVVVGLMIRATGSALPAALAGVVAGVALGGGFSLVTRTPWAWLGGAVVGLAAASVWQPCVGAHLGDILSTGSIEPLAGSISMLPYALGISLPVPAVGFAAELLPANLGKWLARGVMVGGALMAVGVAVGWHVPVVGFLARWSARLVS
jgi:cytochrome c biogenesis protein CcdA